MKQYLDIVATTLAKGRRKVNRTGIDTFAVANQHFSHDMCDGFPLLTTKKMPFKTLCVELEGFIGGITSKKWYQDRGCKIWNEWANPQAVQDVLDSDGFNSRGYIPPTAADRKQIQLGVDDLGPIYGYQWRRFGIDYEISRGGRPPFVIDDQSIAGPITEKLKPHLAPYDQLATIVDKLRNNPNDRRLVCSAWSPLQLDQMGLPACHTMFVLTHIDGILNLHWTQRSCDLMLGVPFNIASYAILLELLAKEGGLQAGNLSGILCDCHIYENQMEGANEQLQRQPLPLPKLNITKFTSIFDWDYRDAELQDYKSLDKIDFGAVAV